MPQPEYPPPAVRQPWILARLAVSPLPVSVRSIFYQLVGHYGYPKTDRAYKAISRDLKQMRWDGQVPFTYIADATRRPYSLPALTNLTASEAVHEAIADTAPVTSIWEPLGIRPHIWVESRSAAGMLEPIADKYEIGLWPCAGHPSVTVLWQGAGQQPTHIGILTDWDKAGRTIRRNITADHHRHGSHPQPTTIAVTPRQISDWDLTESVKPGEAAYGGVELEAIPPDRLLSITEDWILGLLPEGAASWAAYEQHRSTIADQITEIAASIIT